MPTEVYLVKSGMTMTEGIVEEWYVADGARVETGELLYRMETEKINLDVEAEASGTVKHLVTAGVTKEPGDVVGYIFADGEAIPDDVGADAGAGATGAATGAASSAANETPMPVAPAPAAAESAAAPPAVAPAGGRVLSSPAARRLAGELGVDFTQASGTGPGGRIVEADVRVLAAGGAAVMAAAPPASSPVARKLAREMDVDLATVAGTGPGGRITKEDIERAGAAGQAPAMVPGTSVRMSSMRKTIARRMHESLQQTAQLTMDMDAWMDDAVKLRKQLIEEWTDDGVRPTYTDLVIRASAKALEKHSLMNSSIDGDSLVTHGSIHVGMAVALPEGLIVPVVKDANRLSMRALCEETSRLAAAARDSKLSVDDLQGGTFTVSALGMFGVDSFTPIINAPQAGILGVNRLRDEVRWEGERPVKAQAMRLSLTWDHRILDGAPAAEFVATVRDLLEAPFRLLI